MRLAIALVWVSLAALPAVALDPRQPFSSYIRTRFTTDDGLPASVVDVIQQTPDGFLWLIVNGNYLTRFDGRRFYGFEGLAATTLAVGPNGDLWIGTRDDLRQIPFDGLDRADLSGAVSHREGLRPGNEILTLRFGRNGTLWVGTKQGLFRFDDGRFFPVGPRVEVHSIQQTANGHLLLSTAAGLMELDNEQVVSVRELETQLGARGGEIFHALEDSQGNLWYCSSKGVVRRSGTRWLRLPPYGVEGHGAHRSYEDAQGNVWVTGAKGLLRATATGLELAAPGMEVRNVFSDRDGTLWIGTNGDGLYRFKDPAVRMFTTADGLPSDVIMTVLTAHDGSIWTGANCGGLTRFDGALSHTYSEKDGLLNSCVWALAEDADHDLWVGTWGGGAFRFHEGRFTQVLAGNVRSIVAAKDGSVWFATQTGVARLKGGQVRNYTTGDGLAKDRTVKLFEDRQGRILASNWGGIDRFTGDRFENLSRVPKTLALPMGEDRSGGLFVLLDGQPSALRIAGDRVDSIPELYQERGLIETAEGDLWFAGFGVRKVPSSSFARPRPRDEPLDDERFGPQDGLMAEVSVGDPNMALGDDGTIWVATPRGLAMCDPRRLPGRVDQPKIYMTEVTVGRDSRPAPRELVLQPGTSHVEIGLAAVEISSPEKIRMQYRLDGVDPEWLDAGSSARAIYSNIPAGAHALRVRACNRRGVWDRAGIAYAIHQQPHFYQTSWFGVVAAAAIVGVAWASVRLRVRQVTARLDARFEERLAERTRIAGELHDTLLQGVLSVSMQLHLASDAVPSDAPAKGQLGKIRALLDRVIDDARRSVQGLRTTVTEPSNHLELAISRIPEELGGAKGSSFRVIVNGRPRSLRPVLRDEVYRICREGLLNAFRHSGASNIEVEISYLGRELAVVVRDDGRGFDPAIFRSGREGHWGLPGMRERAERIGGRLTLRSRAGSGTELELTLPARVAFADHPPGWFRRFVNRSSTRDLR
jgi:signal transduction histidine kinase/ligand-binding sensor domain-containing protein